MRKFKDNSIFMFDREYICFESSERDGNWSKDFYFRGWSDKSYLIAYDERHDDINIPTRHFMCIDNKKISMICDIIFNKKDKRDIPYSIKNIILRESMKFQVGDIVKVVKKVDRWGYWTNGREWLPEMDDAIGKEFEIYDFNSDINSYKIEERWGSNYFPEDSLELIKRR